MHAWRYTLTQRRWSQLAILLVAVVLFVIPTGCARNKPRKHWWQFWRPKATDTQVYTPGNVILPPPPGTLSPDAAGGGSQLGSDLPPGAELPEPDAIRQNALGSISQLQTIHFDYDSDQLNAEAQRLLDQNAQFLLANPSYEVQIEGHCDERGTNEYNLNLGDRRAKQVKAYLVSKGVDAEHLHTISYGEERPLQKDGGDSEDGWWSKNRRVQFLIYG